MSVLGELAFPVFVDAALVMVGDVPSRAGCIPRGSITLSQLWLCVGVFWHKPNKLIDDKDSDNHIRGGWDDTIRET